MIDFEESTSSNPRAPRPSLCGPVNCRRQICRGCLFLGSRTRARYGREFVFAASPAIMSTTPGAPSVWCRPLSSRPRPFRFRAERSQRCGQIRGVGRRHCTLQDGMSVIQSSSDDAFRRSRISRSWRHQRRLAMSSCRRWRPAQGGWPRGWRLKLWMRADRSSTRLRRTRSDGQAASLIFRSIPPSEVRHQDPTFTEAAQVVHRCVGSSIRLRSNGSSWNVLCSMSKSPDRHSPRQSSTCVGSALGLSTT